MQETQVQSLGWEDPLENQMATHSSMLVWKIPWTENSDGYSPWIFQARILEWVAISFSRGSSQLGSEPGSPALQADSLLTDLQGKPIICFITL